MKIIDSHIHMHVDTKTDLVSLRKKYQQNINSAGVWGSQVMSPDPKRYGLSSEERLKIVMEFCKDQDNLYPFYWVNPMEEDALTQIDKAVEAGIMGFKIICSGFYPGDEKVIAACTRIAEHNKPVLFHSGILWDGCESAKYNRPGEFEALIKVSNLRFCLAHVSWPWTDECIAVYGKISNARIRRPGTSCEMFIDITPGSPHVHREELIKRLYGCEYQIKYNVMFGTDCNTENYNIGWTKGWINTDIPLVENYSLEENKQDVLEHLYYKNFIRFIGKSDEKIKRISPDVAV